LAILLLLLSINVDALWFFLWSVAQESFLWSFIEFGAVVSEMFCKQLLMDRRTDGRQKQTDQNSSLWGLGELKTQSNIMNINVNIVDCC